MKKEYIIQQYESANQIKYSITYIGGEFDGLKEFYAYDINNPQTEIRQGYTKHPDSLPYEEGSNVILRTASKVISPAIEKKVVIDNIEYKLVENKLSWWKRFLNKFK